MNDEQTPSAPPVVVDLGTVKKKHIKRLKRGEGKLLAQVDEVVDVVTSELEGELSGKELLPVVMIVREKAKRRRLFNI